MKNKVNLIIGIIIGSIITGTIVYAASGLTARNIGYSDDTAKSALDDLYKKYDLNSIESKKVCQYQSEGSFGAKGTVGAKYKCQLGAEDKDTNGVIYRYFYILSVNNDNTVDLIMDKNITQGTSYKTMTWTDAMKFFSNSNVAGGIGTSIKSNWVNVLRVDLPSAQDIADAVGNNSFDITSGVSRLCFEEKTNAISCSNTNYNDLWLWDYTRDCTNYGCSHSLSGTEAYGYWTKNLINSTSYSWMVYRYGQISYDAISASGDYGIRPVITLLKSNLYD